MFTTIIAAAFLFFTPVFANQNSEKQEAGWLLEDEKNTIQIFNKGADSVVFVNTTAQVRDFFSMNVLEIPAGAGTGFVWDQKGHIVTNYHVIERAMSNKVKITLKDGRSLDAKIIGKDPRRDIAVLKISETKNLPIGFSAMLADSSKLQVGQKTIAIGNPFELSHTLTTGVVSALGRSVPSPVAGITHRDMIQTDAAINPGNSGGPLMDSRGYLIGMNSSIYSQSGNSAGVGFAVPSNTIKRIVEQIIKFGKVSQPGLGIIYVPENYHRYLGLKNIKGLVIGKVYPGGAASKAGLRGLVSKNDMINLGDIVVAVDGKPIENVDDLWGALENKNVGDEVAVEFLRNRTKKTTTVKLDNIQELENERD